MTSTHKNDRRMAPEAKLQMTAMIDVVFLLLIFFISVVRPVDVLAYLDASRPKPGGGDMSLLKIDVYSNHYAINGKRVDLHQMENYLNKIANISKTQSIIITCSSDSPHSSLIKVLDICAKAGLERLSLMSR